MIVKTLKLKDNLYVSKKGFANVELGSDLKLLNLEGYYRIVELVEGGNSAMRRVWEGELEGGTPFRANLEDLNIDWVA